MAKTNVTKRDVRNVAIGFGAGTVSTLVVKEMVIPAVKKMVQKKKAAKATVDVNIKNPSSTTPETNPEN